MDNKGIVSGAAVKAVIAAAADYRVIGFSTSNDVISIKSIICLGSTVIRIIFIQDNCVIFVGE